MHRWHSVCFIVIRDRFPAGEITNLLSDYFEGFNEGVIGR